MPSMTRNFKGLPGNFDLTVTRVCSVPRSHSERTGLGTMLFFKAGVKDNLDEAGGRETEWVARLSMCVFQGRGFACGLGEGKWGEKTQKRPLGGGLTMQLGREDA